MAAIVKHDRPKILNIGEPLIREHWLHDIAHQSMRAPGNVE
jgi:hypothetical protein